MKLSRMAGILAMAVSLTSCVAKKQYEALELNYKQCIENAGAKESQIQELTSRAASLTSENNLLREQNASLKSSLDACLSNTGKGSANIDKLIGEINSSNAYIKRLIASNTRKDSLNTVLSDRIKRSLDDVKDNDVEVKVQKGVVFISLSDKMLYQSGSYDVLPSAELVLGKVAKIINDYDTYDVLVEGHTDNNPIRSVTIKDNWDLSALRATSVVRMLQNKFGVNPARMTAGGRSEFVPKASNASISGRAANRRTEIIILPKLDEFMKLLDIAPVKK